jgi:hypothetical protein
MKSTIGRVFVAFLLSSLSAPAFAGGPKFSAWEGPAERTGTGGVKDTVNGIDIWTSGEPPRSYKVLGILTRKHSGDGLGKASRYAELIKQYGGDAGIVMSTEKQITGAIAITPYLSAPTGETTVQVMVVKYLP